MSKRLKEIDLYKVYLKWYEGCREFRCFFRTTNFVTLKHYPDFLLNTTSLEDISCSRLYEIIDSHIKQNTLFILDLSGEQAINAAYMLQKDKLLKPILTFNNVMHPFGLIGTKQYISNLIICGEAIESIEPKGFVFVLDQQRYGEYSPEALREFFNNQYELAEGDLPSYEMLEELKYKNVVYIYSGEIKEDIGSYLDYLITQNISVIKEMLQGEP